MQSASRALTVSGPHAGEHPGEQLQRLDQVAPGAAGLGWRPPAPCAAVTRPAPAAGDWASAGRWRSCSPPPAGRRARSRVRRSRVRPAARRCCRGPRGRWTSPAVAPHGDRLSRFHGNFRYATFRIEMRETRMAPTPPAGYRAWLGLGLLTLPLFVLAVDASVLYLAASHIGAALAPSASAMAVDPRQLRLPDRRLSGDHGLRRRPNRTPTAVAAGGRGFALLSGLAAYAPNPELLIGARALLGVAGATLMPSTLAPDPDPVPGRPPPHHRDRGLDDHLLRRGGARPGDRRGAADRVLVGRGVPARGTGDAAGPAPRTLATAGEPGHRTGPGRPGQCPAVGRLGDRPGVRDEDHGRHRTDRRGVGVPHHRRPARTAVPTPATAPVPSAGRRGPVRGARVPDRPDAAPAGESSRSPR